MTKRTLFIVPIEPLAERYTEQWYRRIPEFFDRAGYNVVVIDGQPLEKEVKVGTFLDINSTCHYKATQLQGIAKLFHTGNVPPHSTFFFLDLEFWGLEQVRLLADMNKVPIFLTGFLHAASYTKEDAFEIAAHYQRHTEVGWIAACDRVFVGSEYHKRAVTTRRLEPQMAVHHTHKLIATGNPVFVDEYAKYRLKRRKKFVLTNRMDKEKRPLETLKLFKKLKEQYPDWEFVVTTGRSTFRGTDTEAIDFALQMQQDKLLTIKAGLTKDEYHRELASAMFMVTHSIEENYGYCIAEAIHYGVIPLMRRGLSHNEFVAASGAEYKLENYTFTNSGRHTAWALAKQWIERVNSGDTLEVSRLKLSTYGLENIADEIDLLYDGIFSVDLHMVSAHSNSAGV